MELQQIGLQHPAANLVRDIQHNRSGIPRRTFVAEGLFENNIVLESGVAVETFLWCPEASYSDESRTRAEQLAGRARRAYRISEKTLARLAERPNPDGLLTIARLPDWEPEEFAFGEDALVLVTDALEIPGNLGTLLRTMDACAADCLVMTNRRTRMTHPKVLRSSQGMSIKVPSFDFDDTGEAIGWLERNDFRVYLADTDESVNYRQLDYRGRTALVVGSERFGISRPWYESGFQRVGIPMLGSADSLNVSVSASVLLYEARAHKSGW
ncbi:TrmH family RNA methyltransferase [Amycolatopsis jiangsuensis]|uniref:TrmH family RNA methyltransferase n=1 Tax=Amycolatopsis jiangsuensis TaxID=1181879 RepID=A0A840IVJ6_9PSEU|nr:TrmH family RNA methyltransferase [Amycolatopsis jiangsuensis]MBB4685783.1 TrmH family RNA methyltransferase [Amycolatopsis jiangsuensis]